MVTDRVLYPIWLDHSAQHLEKKYVLVNDTDLPYDPVTERKQIKT